MKLQELHDQVLDHVKKGEFAQGIENFYAEHVTQQVNNQEIQSGRESLASAEYEYQNKVTNLERVDVLARMIDDHGDGNGVIMYEVQMIWDHEDQGRVNIEQAVVERWKGGKIESIRFYGEIG